MEFEQATITKLDNGYVVAIQGYSELKKEKIGKQVIAATLEEALGFLNGEKKTASIMGIHGAGRS